MGERAVAAFNVDDSVARRVLGGCDASRGPSVINRSSLTAAAAAAAAAGGGDGGGGGGGGPKA